MTIISIPPSSLKTCIGISKIVKPIFGDYSIIFSEDSLKISSLEKRRSITSILYYDKIEGINDEFFLPIDRSSIFESDLEKLQFNISDKGLNVKFTSSDTVRSALIKRRSNNSKRPRPPSDPSLENCHEINPKLFDNILKSVSCSALVKETHSEEDMKINQVHFDSLTKTVSSNARFYATFVTDNSINFDLSVVSSDIPYLRNFCAKVKGNLLIKNDKNQTYFIDSQSKTWICFGNIKGIKPEGKKPNVDIPNNSIEVESEVFKNAVKWVSSTLDGTQRVTVNLISQKLEFKNNDLLLTSIKTINNDNSVDNFSSDFPINVLSVIAEHLSEQSVKMIFKIKSLPEILVFEQSEPSGTVSSHFVRSMKSK